ncbi:hypothetical protein [uncultured Clostridium sp.]|uniref:hypothetical protein n=1 Tax=uncultured Clostridium sp. TaxID=59620 RepID=UPI002601F5ED|nr:hypothetical protein [uncultured Clostridium sp.]
MKLNKVFNKENMMNIKFTISEIMEKKSELDLQISDFKSGVEDIKNGKEQISKMMNDINKKEVKKINRIYKMVQEKKNK